jgi:hypothetical protein
LQPKHCMATTTLSISNTSNHETICWPSPSCVRMPLDIIQPPGVIRSPGKHTPAADPHRLSPPPSPPPFLSQQLQHCSTTHASNPRHRHITALICVAVVRVHGRLAPLPPHRDHARRQTHETADTTRTSNAALSRYTAHLNSAWHTSTHTPACASPVEVGACALRIGTSVTVRRLVRLIRQLLR